MQAWRVGGAKVVAPSFELFPPSIGAGVATGALVYSGTFPTEILQCGLVHLSLPDMSAWACTT